MRDTSQTEKSFTILEFLTGLGTSLEHHHPKISSSDLFVDCLTFAVVCRFRVYFELVIASQSFGTDGSR